MGMMMVQVLLQMELQAENRHRGGDDDGGCAAENGGAS